MHPIECFNWGAENPSQLCQTCATSTSLPAAYQGEEVGRKKTRTFGSTRAPCGHSRASPEKSAVIGASFPILLFRSPIVIYIYIFFFQKCIFTVNRIAFFLLLLSFRWVEHLAQESSGKGQTWKDTSMWALLKLFFCSKWKFPPCLVFHAKQSQKRE